MIIREKYLENIRPFYDNQLIKVLVGVRRSGKTCILNSIMGELIARGVGEEQIIYFNMESIENFELRDFLKFHNHIKEKCHKTKKTYIFIDEIQFVPKFEETINSLRSTLNVSIFITGSNANLLSGELATLLTGRYVSFKIYPFDYKEYIQLTQKNPRDHKVFHDYLVFGGFPQVIEFNDEKAKSALLSDLLDTIIFKDISARAQIRDNSLLIDVVKYIISESGKTFSPVSIAKYFNSIGIKTNEMTVRMYLDHIVNGMLVTRCERYDIKGKQRLSREEKYYIIEHGLKNAVQNTNKLETGRLLEIVVFNHLISNGYNVSIGKVGEYEVDFIAQRDGMKKYIQVSLSIVDENVANREYRPLELIKDAYEKILITMDPFSVGKNGIKHINIIDFLLSDI